MVTDRTVLERCGHALLFEVFALFLCAPFIAWITGQSIVQAGILTLLISLIAMLWNIVFNSAFDWFERRRDRQDGLYLRKYHRTLAVRILHACTFEIGLVLLVIPLIAWWLQISLLKAFWFDIGMVLFFLPYTFVYNWIYDNVRERVLSRRSME